MPHLIYILFFFALGACVGSFLNVVVWRLPRGESLVSPPSHCPKCNHRLAWYDNIPVFGWIFLGGKCRYCKVPISARYPIVEAITGLLFALYYACFFIFDLGPAVPPLRTVVGGEEVIYFSSIGWDISRDWPIFGLYLFVIASLLAASLIDAELFIIPLEIPWLMAGVAILVHAIVDRPTLPGALNLGPPAAALAMGGGVGLAISMTLWKFGIMPTSFPQGEPMLEADRDIIQEEIDQAKREGREMPPLPPVYTRKEIRREIQREMIFLMPPMILAAAWCVLVMRVPTINAWWGALVEGHYWLSGMLGAILGALVGGFVVWLTRILGTLGFGRVAMGLGDVHLMFGVGAAIGAGAVTIAFFLAPFFGILIALYMLVTGTRRELPYGPYLSLATAFVMLFYEPIANYLRPGIEGLVWMMQGLMGGGGA